MSLSALFLNKYPGTVTAKEAIALLDNPLDKSEFIFLMMGFFKKLIDDHIISSSYILPIIHEAYFSTHYEECIGMIFQFMMKEKKISELLKVTLEGVVPEESILQISNKKSITTNNLPEPNIYKNYTRRFFENRVAQFYTALMADADKLSILQEVIQPYSGMPITTIESLQNSIAVLHDNASDEMIDRGKEIKKMTDLYSTKDRSIVINPGNSVNLGMLNSNAPNPLDERSTTILKNRVSDRGKLVVRNTGYSFNHPRHAFVGSISGHVYGMIAILEDYAKNNIHNPKLNEYVNLTLKAFLLTYVNLGFHSFGEMLDIFKQEPVSDIFKKYLVYLDLTIPVQVLEHAFNDTQSYNKTVCLQKAVNLEILKNKCEKVFAEKNWPQVLAVLATLKSDDLYTYLRNARLTDAEMKELLELSKSDEKYQEVYYTLLERSPYELYFSLSYSDMNVANMLKDLRDLDLNSVPELRKALIAKPNYNSQIFIQANIFKRLHLIGETKIINAILAEPDHRIYNVCSLIEPIIGLRIYDKQLFLRILEMAQKEEDLKLENMHEATMLTIEVEVPTKYIHNMLKLPAPLPIAKLMVMLHTADRKLVRKEKLLKLLFAQPSTDIVLGCIELHKKSLLTDDVLELLLKNSDKAMAIIMLKKASYERSLKGQSDIFREPFLGLLEQYPNSAHLIVDCINTLSDKKLQQIESMMLTHPTKKIGLLFSQVILETDATKPDMLYNKYVDTGNLSDEEFFFELNVLFNNVDAVKHYLEQFNNRKKPSDTSYKFFSPVDQASVFLKIQLVALVQSAFLGHQEIIQLLIPSMIETAKRIPEYDDLSKFSKEEEIYVSLLYGATLSPMQELSSVQAIFNDSLTKLTHLPTGKDQLKKLIDDLQATQSPVNAELMNKNIEVLKNVYDQLGPDSTKGLDLG